MESTYLLVDKSVVPEVFIKVVDAKKKLSSGRYKTVNDALCAANISRSAFYKYKNYVYEYTVFDTNQLVTLFFTLDDVAGILSDILNKLSLEGANILTIYQNIPVNNTANVTISMRTDNMKTDIESMVEKLKAIDGVNKLDILSM